MSDMQELLESYAWRAICQALEKRKAALIRDLMSKSDLLDITRSQAAIREIDYVVNLPHEMKEGKNER